MSDDISKILSEAAALPETETLKTDAIVGKTFTILDARSVETQYGTSWVATIDLDGATDAGKLPVTVTMTRDESRYGNPFTLLA